jgi:hypothetical protein
MLDPRRHDEELARPEGDGAVPQLDVEPALEHQEEVVGLGMAVPDERATAFHHHHVVAVEAGDDARRPGLVEGGERRSQADGGHMQRPPSTSSADAGDHEASSEQRKAAAAPRSWGVEKRPSGMVARNFARISGVSSPRKDFRSGVSPATGQSALTLMPRGRVRPPSPWWR